MISGAIEPGKLHSVKGKDHDHPGLRDDENDLQGIKQVVAFPAFPIPAYFRWLSENETKLICPIAIRNQRIEYEVLCTKAIAARRSTTSKRLTAN